MTITFNNSVYQTGFAGEDDGAPTTATSLDNVSTNSITVNGTVTNVGDTVTVTGLLPGSADSGNTSTTNTLYVTSFDNAGMIEFSSNPPNNQANNATPAPFRYFLSNTALSARQRVTLNTDPALSQYQPVCFASGTRIRTSRGDVEVELLVAGDVAVTASGQHCPIKWIGCRHIAHPDAGQLPVRVRAGAFDADRPARDLLLSPGHPVLVGAGDDGEHGYLTPIMCLINGTTIARVSVDEVTYWHVELDHHDILLADGLPAESYLDWGDRAFFENNSDHALHNPDFVVPGLRGRCRPVALDGPVVIAERHRLDAVFSEQLAAQCAWPSVDVPFSVV